MNKSMPIEIGTKVVSGIEESNRFFNMICKVTAVCSCGWRGKTHSQPNIFSSKNIAQRLALLEFFLHEKSH